MIHAVFTADRRVLARFDDRDHPHGSLFLAQRALQTIYRDHLGAFVDGLCTQHGEPKTDCRRCDEHLSVVCLECSPTRACRRHH
ncbi:hypothetical protein [Streptomyces sp. XH2]|uniref:hypothetical protein n=1 Tax=Streptomyces sp. XH2 TaxID=3412483 RepID=UPI003C7E87EA